MRRIVAALLLLVGAGSAQAQSSDSTLVGRTKANIDTTATQLEKYCRTSGARGYVCNTRGNLAKAAVWNDSILKNPTRVDTVIKIDTVYVTKPDTVKPPPIDTTKPPPINNVLSIDIHSNGTSVKVDSSLQLSAEVKNQDGTPSTVPVSWGLTEGSRTYGTISSTGLLTGVKGGMVTVVAKADTFTNKRDYTVIAPPPDTVVVPPDTIKPPPTDTTGGPPPGGTAWTHPFGLFTNQAVPAEFPRDTVDVAYPSITRKIAVTPTTLQAALDSAKTGDELLLPPGSVTNTTYLNLTSRAGWVVVRTAVQDDGNIWKMMTLGKADSLNLATIQTVGGNAAALHFQQGAHHIRFTLVKIIQGYPGPLNAIVRMNNPNTTMVSQLPHHIVFDRVVVNGLLGNNRRCFYADAAYFAVISSQIRNCHDGSADSQGVISLNGTGPFRVENNTIEAGHQYTMSGGGDPSIPNLIPCDWVVRNNIMTRPLSWKGVWQVKTGIETKNQCRALYEYNVIENVWPDAQAGFCILFKSTNQDGTAPWSQTKDVTFRYNRLRNCASGINLAANPQGGVPMTRVTIYDNYFDPVGNALVGGDGIPLQFLGGLTDMVVLHNTWWNPSKLNAIQVDGGANTRTVLRSNYIPNGQYGVKGSGTAAGTATLNAFFLQSLWENMAIVGASCSVYPAGTTCPTSIPASPPLGADGKPLGADMSKVHP